MKKVTYIVPVHIYDDEAKGYATRAFQSLDKMDGHGTSEVLLVGELDIIMQYQHLFSEVVSEDNTQVVTLLPTKTTDLFEKINLAVSKSTGEYFSILEFDDTYYPYWNNVAQHYLADDEYSVVLPMTEILTPDGTIAGLANEIAWDISFADTIGEISLDELLVFKDFLTSGAYIKTRDFLELGSLKPELKLAAWYEYLLNVANAGKKIGVAPRIGYQHTVLREGSYMSNIEKELTKEEGIKLIELAITPYKKENKS